MCWTPRFFSAVSTGGQDLAPSAAAGPQAEMSHAGRGAAASMHSQIISARPTTSSTAALGLGPT
jgi:hypothetical protein